MADTHADHPARERDAQLVERMLALFRLETDGLDVFATAGAQTAPRRVFGGQLIAQALVAAASTTQADRQVHSVHAYFVRAGVTTQPSRIEVERHADGSSYSFRGVRVRQAGDTLLSLGAAFGAARSALAHQAQMPDVPQPERLDDDWLQAEHAPGASALAKGALARASPFQFRTVDPAQAFAATAEPTRHRYWFRTARPLPEIDQRTQRVILAYASDTRLMGVGLAPHGRRWFDGSARVASLDHALWIHGDVRTDEWLLYDQESPWSGEGRSLGRGHIFDRAGRLVATVAQEGSVRLAASEPA